MHLSRADFAPVILIVLIAIPLFIARRRIRRLETDEYRLLVGGYNAQAATCDSDCRFYFGDVSSAETHRGEDRQKQPKLDQKDLTAIRFDLALMRKVVRRAWWLLGASFFFLLVMLLVA